MKRKINIAEAKMIPLEAFLEKNNFYPFKKSGNNYWYLSPFRDEKEPSFKINTVLNVWFDHGIGIGGTIIDLGIELYKCSIPDLLVRLSDNNFSFHQPLFNQSKLNESKIEVIEIKKLNNYCLIDYLKNRRISIKNAEECCKEVTFRLNERVFFAIGFPNDSGGYELRNKSFKSTVSPKDITTIINNSTNLCVFEGFFDFLSFLQLNILKPEKSDYMILNSLSFLSRASKYFKNYEKIYFYLDNDPAGGEANNKILQMGLSSIEDCGHLYAPNKDLNDFLVRQTKEEYKELENQVMNYKTPPLKF